MHKYICPCELESMSLSSQLIIQLDSQFGKSKFLQKFIQFDNYGDKHVKTISFQEEMCVPSSNFQKLDMTLVQRIKWTR